MDTSVDHTSDDDGGLTCSVSVVMSVYNGERFLRHAVDSILAQTLRDFEFIVVDDGSTDGTAAILESYSDPRMRVVHQRNMGLTESLQTGQGMARGEFFARQDADDVSLPARLERQLHFLGRNPGVLAVGTSCFEIDQDNRRVRRMDLPLHDRGCKERLAMSSPIAHGSAMVRMGVLQELAGYRTRFRFGQDRDLWLRISEREELGNLPEILYLWRRNPEDIGESRRPEQQEMSNLALEMALQRLRHGVDDIGLELRSQGDRKALARHRLYLGLGLVQRRGVLPGLRLMLDAVRANGGDPTAWFWLLIGVPTRILQQAEQRLRIWLADKIKRRTSGPSPSNKLPAPNGDP